MPNNYRDTLVDLIQKSIHKPNSADQEKMCQIVKHLTDDVFTLIDNLTVIAEEAVKLNSNIESQTAALNQLDNRLNQIKTAIEKIK